MVVAHYFKDPRDPSNPFLMTNTQARIFKSIYESLITRVAIKTPTQYGKSDVTALACLMILCERREKIAIVAPKKLQATIIMNDLISHLFDHPDITAQLDMPSDQKSLSRLRTEKSKNRLTFRKGGEIYIITADVNTIKEEGKALMGFGATIVIADEASLIPKKIYTKILRMVGGSKEGKIVKLGNPFFRNHFYDSFNDKRFYKVSIDWRVAVEEGRFTLDFIDEMRENSDEEDFMILYDTKFPDRSGENSLISGEWLDAAVNRTLKNPENIKQVGIDIARYGGDKSIYYLRIGGKVVKRKTFKKLDLMELVGRLRVELDIDKPDVVALDIVGMGAGVYDRLVELGYTNIVGVNAGANPPKQYIDQYLNMRAYIYWNLREVFSRGNISLEFDQELFQELSETDYFFVSDKKKKIQSKDEIKKKIGRSTDKADALALCFATVEVNSVQFGFSD